MVPPKPQQPKTIRENIINLAIHKNTATTTVTTMNPTAPLDVPNRRNSSDSFDDSVSGSRRFLIDSMPTWSNRDPSGRRLKEPCSSATRADTTTITDFSRREQRRMILSPASAKKEQEEESFASLPCASDAAAAVATRRRPRRKDVDSSSLMGQKQQQQQQQQRLLLSRASSGRASMTSSTLSLPQEIKVYHRSSQKSLVKLSFLKKPPPYSCTDAAAATTTSSKTTAEESFQREALENVRRKSVDIYKASNLAPILGYTGQEEKERGTFASQHKTSSSHRNTAVLSKRSSNPQTAAAKATKKPTRQDDNVVTNVSDEEKTSPAFPKHDLDEGTTAVFAFSSGMTLRLRGAQETWDCIANDTYTVGLTCAGCAKTDMCCIMDASFVLCPMCYTISPVESSDALTEGEGIAVESASIVTRTMKINVPLHDYDNDCKSGGGGIGLGFTLEDLQTWQSEIMMQD